MPKAVTGWVYVISNPSMPGLVKVGCTESEKKTPRDRARELGGTGIPHDHLVEYGAVVRDPYHIERLAHRRLEHLRDRKEWFKCGCSEAVAVIKLVAEHHIVREDFARIKREVAEKKHLQELQSQQIETLMNREEAAIRASYQRKREQLIGERPFWQFWLGGAIAVLFGVSVIYPKMSDAVAFLWLMLGGGLLGMFAQNFYEGSKRKGSAYQQLLARESADLEAVRAIVVDCPNCQQSLRFKRFDLLMTGTIKQWTCPTCRRDIDQPETGI